MSLFCFTSWRTFLLDIELSVESSFLSTLKDVATVFWPPWVSEGKSTVTHNSACNVPFFSAVWFFDLSHLSLISSSLITICVGMVFFNFFPFGVHGSSWIFKCMCFAKLGKFSSIISWVYFSTPISLFLLVLQWHKYFIFRYCHTDWWCSFLKI